MKPRASASFCHWPKLTSTPSGQVGPSCVSSPAASRATTSSAPARSTAATTAGSSSSRGTSPTPTVCRARNSNRKKSWNAPASRDRHASAGMRASSTPVHQDATARRLIQPAQQLHERGLAGAVLADDGHHRAGLQVAGRRPRARGAPCRDRRRRRARSESRPTSRSGTGASAVLDPARPRSPRARPGAASRRARCRAGSRSLPPWRRCTPRAASRPPAPAARCPASRWTTTTTNTTAPTNPAPKIAHASVCHRALPQRAAATGPYQRSHAARRPAARRSPMPRDAHLLAGRRRRGRGEQVPRQPVRRRAPLLGGALDARPPRRR